MEFGTKYGEVLRKIGIVGGVYLIVKYLVPPTIPFWIAALAAWWLRPLFVRLRKWFKVKPGVWAVVFLVMVLVAIGGIAYYAGGQVLSLSGEVMGRRRILVSMEQMLWNCCETAEQLLGFPAKDVEQVILTQVHGWQEKMQDSWIFDVFGGSFTALKGVGKVAAAVVVGAVAFVMLSADFDKIKEEASASALFARLVAVGRGIKEAIGSYVRAQCIIIALIMGICVVGFLFTGSPYAVVLGIFTGLLDALPVLGTSIVIVPWLVVEAIRGNYLTAVILGLTYAACALTREILEPRLVGKRLGLFPVLVLLSVYVGVKAYGGAGIVLGPLSLLVIQELWREL